MSIQIKQKSSDKVKTAETMSGLKKLSVDHDLIKLTRIFGQRKQLKIYHIWDNTNFYDDEDDEDKMIEATSLY